MYKEEAVNSIWGKNSETSIFSVLNQKAWRATVIITDSVLRRTMSYTIMNGTTAWTIIAKCMGCCTTCRTTRPCWMPVWCCYRFSVATRLTICCTINRYVYGSYYTLPTNRVNLPLCATVHRAFINTPKKPVYINRNYRLKSWTIESNLIVSFFSISITDFVKAQIIDSFYVHY